MITIKEDIRKLLKGCQTSHVSKLEKLDEMDNFMEIYKLPN